MQYISFICKSKVTAQKHYSSSSQILFYLNQYAQIEQLQMRLQQEKSMRMVLERAMGRASSTLSPGHRHFAAQVLDL